MENVFMHVDLDAFFASVEYLDNPQWKGKPLIVGGLPSDRRSVVSTASYEARKFGVHSAMPTASAYRLCPHGIFVRPRMKRYLEKSEEVMSILNNYSPDVQQISIDEAFIDITGTEKLFGKPLETAEKLKKEIFQKTGLTVSVGIASTKYLAKIASDIKKPDGIFLIEPGTETDFMMSLPLKKMWGLGEKSLSKLKSKGITTAKQIFEKPLPLLKAFFGDAMGNFLFNAVRGQEKETFNQKPKNHSLSAENTYQTDLYDSSAIDTALLELCSTVIFRMRKERVRSSCLSIKIRYDDFSTTTVQETSGREISSIEDMFERAKALFKKKYEKSRGIRLLGVGVFNTEKNGTPHQQELFDFGNEKKRKVEEAVLKLSEKNPELKVTKARLLKSTDLKSAAIFFTSLFLFLGADKAFSTPHKTDTVESSGAGAIVFDTEKLPPLVPSDSKSIFRHTVNDKEIEFSASGWWKTFFDTGAILSFGFGNEPLLSAEIPHFSSEIDLSLFFSIDNRICFEASAADSFDTNTVALEFYGEKFFKKIRIANRGIAFPKDYSVEKLNRGIGGGNNEAPGILFNFENETTKADALLRYEQLSSHSKTWYGKNSSTVSEIELSDFIVGRQFVLPSENAVKNVKSVFVEASDGGYTDTNGRKYKKLDESKFILSAQNCSIFISKDAGTGKKNGVIPAVAVEFFDSYGFLSELGSYGTHSAPGTGFLGETQKYFSKDLKNYSVDFSPQKIGGADAYFVQYPSKFSPFQAAFRYAAGILTSADASVQSANSESVLEDFTVNLQSGDIFLSDGSESRNQVFASLQKDGAKDFLSPEYRFPLSKTDGNIYLGLKAETDFVLKVRSFSEISRFDIGTSAVENSVKVYKNGILDSGAKYDSQSGTVTLSSDVKQADKITAYWSEDDKDSKHGALAFAAGIKKKFTDAFSADASVSLRKFLYSRDKNDEEAETQDSVAISGGIEFSKNNFTLTNAAGFSAESSASKKRNIISTEEDETETNYLSKNSGTEVPPEIIPKLKLKNGAEQILKQENRTEPKNLSGVTDSEITGNAVPLEFDFSSSEPLSDADDVFWSACSVTLPGAKGILKSSSSFSVALKASGTKQSDFDVYLQLGVLADKDAAFEDASSISTWKITETSELPDGNLPHFFDSKQTDWQIITVRLDDEDRGKFSVNSDARIIVTSKKKMHDRILIGPYELSGTDFSTESENGSPVFVSKSALASSDICTNFEFFNNDAEKFTLTKFFRETDFSSYRELKLNLKFFSAETLSENSKITVALIQQDGAAEKTALEFEISSKDFDKIKNWSEITIDIENKKSSLGKIVSLNKNAVPSKLSVTVETDKNSKLCLGDFYFTGAKARFALQNKTDFSYEKKGDIIKIKNFSLLKNAEIGASADAVLNPAAESGEKNGFFESAFKGNITVANFSVEADFAHEKDSEIPLSKISHSIQTEKKIAGILSLGENFSYDYDEKYENMENFIRADFSPLKVPLNFSSEFSSASDSWSTLQKSSSKIAFDSKYAVFETNLDANQKLKGNGNSDSGGNAVSKNYFESWKNAAKTSFSTGFSDAKTRELSAGAKFGVNTSFFDLKPAVSFSAYSRYENFSASKNACKMNTKFIVPFKTRRASFSFSWEKILSTDEKTDAGGDFFSDFETLTEKIAQNPWYFAAAPFHDLFSEKILSDFGETEKTEKQYSSVYALNCTRNFSASTKDFFLPSGANISFGRKITSSSSKTDIYNLRGTVSFNALNIFGSKSSLSITNLFEQDEYISSLTGILKIPRKDIARTTAAVSFYHQSVFYAAKNRTLKSGLEFTFEDANNFSGKATAVFERPGNNSPILNLIDRFYKIQRKENETVFRSDSVNFIFSRETSASSQRENAAQNYDFSFKHNLDIKMNDFVTVNTKISLNCAFSYKKTSVLTGEFSVGATVEF